jgi:hypothetical protein
MGLKDSLLCSEHPTTGPYFEPDEFSLHPPILVLQDQVQYYFSIYFRLS